MSPCHLQNGVIFNSTLEISGGLSTLRSPENWDKGRQILQLLVAGGLEKIARRDPTKGNANKIIEQIHGISWYFMVMVGVPISEFFLH